jgi:4-hydroxybutyrate CoA-transferase
MESIGKSALNALFEPGDRVYVAGSTGEPRGILEALEPRAALQFVQQPLGAVNRRDLSALSEGSSLETYFMTPEIEAGVAAGRVRFIPMQWRAIYSHLSSIVFDKVLLRAAYDREGRLRFVHNADFLNAVLPRARVVVVEVCRTFLAPAGAPAMTCDRALLFESEAPAITVSTAAIDEASRPIGRHIASLIPDGACLQTGIGAVPAAVVANLRQHNDLGLHGGLLDDALMTLITNGNLTGARKEIDRGHHIIGAALGSDRLLEWLVDQPAVIFRGAEYTHESSVIQQLGRFVSINSAVQVDLFGQVNGEVVAGRQISGTGGSVDFLRAARLSAGGRSIVALQATAKAGAVSRIVPRVEMVTALRSDVDYVVTEYGVASLRAASLAERAEALANVAHPDFRDGLRAAWKDLAGTGRAV